MSIADVYVLDVEQGDSIVVHERSSDGIAVVDCHNPGSSELPTIVLLEELQKERGTCDIDLLCLTHPDRDHYSGMVELLRWSRRKKAKVKQVVLFAPSPTVQVAAEIARMEHTLRALPDVEGADVHPQLASLIQKDLEFAELLRELMELSTEGGAEFDVASGFKELGSIGTAEIFSLGPTDATIQTYQSQVYANMVKAWGSAIPLENESANALSCVLWLHIGKHRVLLTGDATVNALCQAAERYKTRHSDRHGKLPSNFVKASHHGSKHNSSTKLWPTILQPGGHVAFSAGAYKNYLHPNQRTVDDILSTVGRECTLSCTNICEAVISKGRGALSAEVLDQIDEDSLDFGNGRYTKDIRRYNGRLRFILLEDGTVELKHERMHGSAGMPFCANHA